MRTSAEVMHEAHALLAELDTPSKLAAKPPALVIAAQEAEILAELASYAVRRGYTRNAAMQEIESRHPHKFRGDTHASGLTCTWCGRSEIFVNHIREKAGK